MEILGIQEPDVMQPVQGLTWELSFAPYLRFLEGQLAKCHNQTYRSYLQRIADLIRRDKRLTQPIRDWGILKEHEELIELLQLNHVYPFEADQDLLYAIGTPGPLRFFSFSESFAEKVLNRETGALKLKPKDLDCEGEKAMQDTYREVLHRCYGVPYQVFGTEQVEFMKLEDTCEPCSRYFRLISNHQFIDIRWERAKPPLRQEWIDYARGAVQQVQEPLPLHEIVFEGFLIFKLKDETEEESLQRLNDIIVQLHALPEEHLLQQIMAATTSLLGTDKAQLGFLPFVQVNKDFVYHDTFATTSLVFSRLREHHRAEELERIFRKLFSYCASRRLLSTNICYDVITGEEDDEVAQYLYKYGLRSMAFFPVYHQSELIGVIEVGSAEPEFVDLSMRRKVERALPMYREFLLYLQDKFRQIMTTFILERYTAIHPAVLWKFREATWQALRKVPKGSTEYVPTLPVRFNDLTPFYAAVDIRNSSVQRLQATRTDLLRQLADFLPLLPKTMPTQREQTAQWQRQLAQGEMSLELELNVQDHLQVCLEELERQEHKPVAVAAFKQKLEDEGSSFYEAGLRYDHSIREVNKRLKGVLAHQEQQLKDRVPYYINRFQTDGLEYNLYVGNAIMPDLPYDEEQGLSRMIAWQLDTIIRMAVAVHRLQPNLRHPLQTTQLILVHLHKINLSFRRDERIFDVDGAYSIRYEVIKKRIDKVHLLGSEERLTQPGTIAIVYANEQELELYRQAYSRLIAAGRLQQNPEYLELEPLQGVAGLKAVRLSITL